MISSKTLRQRNGVYLYDYLIVGAGLAGCTLAERLSNELGARVIVIDKRSHIAGNTHDPLDGNGLRYHQYGPHIFHSNSDHVVRYLSKFTSWLPYEHRVLANVNGKLVPIPINRTTINELYGLQLTEDEMSTFMAGRVERSGPIANSEQVMLSRVGRELYETFFRGYTLKQWGRDPSQLDATVCGRIPIRTNCDDRYFTDTFQAMPAAGYTAMTGAMLANPAIDVVLNSDYATFADNVRYRHLIYTGPIDEYFDYKFGKLPYRSLRFEFEVLDQAWAQRVGCINEPSDKVPYTRTTEYKHLTQQRHAKTILSREYPCAEGDPYYPIPCPESRELYRQYSALADAQKHVTFVGRLAEYKYFNMDQVVASALATFDDLAMGAAVAS